MAESIEIIEAVDWNLAPGAVTASEATKAAEDGKVVHLPHLAFALSDEERRFLNPDIVEPKAKSLAFNPVSGILKHARGSESDRVAIAAMMNRYVRRTTLLVSSLFPGYAEKLEIGRTSFRPVAITAGKTSIPKDDTLLHVDAFPTSPVGDRRILRIFTNVNPDGQSRHWRLGEPFANVAKSFFPKLRKPVPGSAWLMKTVGLTKAYRTAYDRAMLGIHDAMKEDKSYQARVPQSDFHFPPGSTWIAYTDAVSHAAMSGQHVFEQTFYLPISSMADEAKSPLRILERMAGHPLIPRPALQATG